MTLEEFLRWMAEVGCELYVKEEKRLGRKIIVMCLCVKIRRKKFAAEITTPPLEIQLSKSDIMSYKLKQLMEEIKAARNRYLDTDEL